MPAFIILCILLTWLVCATVGIGAGSLLLRALFPSFQGFSLLDSFWIGIAVITGILLLYHFFRPIDLGEVSLLMGLGVGGWIWNRAALLHFSGSPKFRLTTDNLQLSTLLLLFIAAVLG